MSSEQTTVPVERKRPRSLAHELVEELTGLIRTGAIQPGEKLPTESAIVKQHGVSRTVVREAISRLQANGLVETRHGIGTFVLEPPTSRPLNLDISTLNKVRDIIAILELRLSVENEAASMAARRRTDAQLEAMRQALDAFSDPNASTASCVEADKRFHLLIAEATGNHYFLEILEHLGNTVIPRSRVATEKLTGDDQEKYLERVNREHEDIYNAIRRQDPEAARAAMRTHLSNSRERLVRVQEAAEQAGGIEVSA